MIQLKILLPEALKVFELKNKTESKRSEMFSVKRQVESMLAKTKTLIRFEKKNWRQSCQILRHDVGFDDTRGQDNMPNGGTDESVVRPEKLTH